MKGTMKSLLYALLLFGYIHLSAQTQNGNLLQLDNLLVELDLNNIEPHEPLIETIRNQDNNNLENTSILFNEEYLISTYISQVLDGDSWSDRYKYFYSYDNTNNLIEWVREEWDKGILSKGRRETAIFDADNNLVEWFTEDWDGNIWVNSRHSISTYDDDNRLIERISHDWDGVKWVNDRRYTQTHDVNNNVIEYFSREWDESDWLNTSHLTYSYDESNNLLEYMYQTWNGINWANRDLNKYKYDGNNNCIEYLKQAWSINSEWYNNRMQKTTYDTNNNAIEYINMLWNSTNWDSALVAKFTYDERDNKLENLSQYYHNSEWRNGNKVNYSYDEKNNLIEDTYHNWMDTVWFALSKTLYTFDEKNNLIEELDQHQSSSNSGWEDNTRTLYSYVNITGVEDDLSIIKSFSLSNNYPNPFNPSTTIKYSIPEQSNVSIKVFDVIGREVSTLLNKKQQQGNYEVEFDGSYLPSGIYFYRLQAGDFVETKKMILLK